MQDRPSHCSLTNHVSLIQLVGNDQKAKFHVSAGRSSRLIFRNLPPSLQTSTFQAHLQQPSQLSDVTLTDLKLVAKRRFAFVGYKSPEEAERVKTYFDDTFVGSGKIKVEFVDDEVSSKYSCSTRAKK